MNIVMTSYDSISVDHGGPRVQLFETKKWLEQYGVSVSLFDRWKSFNAASVDAVHFFGARLGTFQAARMMHILQVPIITSPIFFTRHSAQQIAASLKVESLLKKFRTGIWTDYGFTKQICDWSSAILPNTESESSLIANGMHLPVQKIHVIPNGVDERFEHGDPQLFKNKYGLDKFILSVGHIGPARKNIHRLIQALETIDHPAVLIGRITDGRAGEECRVAANRNKNILIIPGLPNDSELLSSAYAACDTFVLPSLFETPGIAALEAGLAGAKIVITPMGGTKEYFGSMAEYVDPASVEAIRDGIINSLQKNRTADLMHHIKKEFLWQMVAQKTYAVYTRTLEERSR
jgi:glycosyltransferase involved in cell wall biosynthesis